MSDDYKTRAQRLQREGMQTDVTYNALKSLCDSHQTELTTIRERVRELEALIAALKDPNVVWSNMLRGDIGLPKHLREADAKLHELGEANEAMHRLHATRMQECLEESKAKDARIRELEEALPAPGFLMFVSQVALCGDVLNASDARRIKDMADRIEKILIPKSASGSKQPEENLDEVR